MRYRSVCKNCLGNCDASRYWDCWMQLPHRQHQDIQIRPLTSRGSDNTNLWNCPCCRLQRIRQSHHDRGLTPHFIQKIQLRGNRCGPNFIILRCQSKITRGHHDHRSTRVNQGRIENASTNFDLIHLVASWKQRTGCLTFGVGEPENYFMASKFSSGHSFGW